MPAYHRGVVHPTPVDAAVILAGGAGRRLGGAGKPWLPVGGAPMLHRVLDAAAGAGATTRIVVGPQWPLPAGVVAVREEPPGSGPAAAAAAGLALLPPGTAHVALLAADLPLLSPPALQRLRRALTAGHDGAVYADGDGRRQWLCGVWRAAALLARVADAADTGDTADSAGPAGTSPAGGATAGGALAGTALRALLTPLRTVTVTGHGSGPPPWWDCDTETDRRRAEDLRRAEEWRSDELADPADPAGTRD